MTLTSVIIFISRFSAQKSHVKPQNHLTLSNQATYSWRISYAEPDIIKVGIKQKPRPAGAFAVQADKRDLTHLFGGF